MQKQAKILLVDDDPDFVEATKTVLESKYQVATAYNGDEGLNKVVEERPDLIILDVVMPGKDGFAVCKELKENPHYHFFSKIPVLLLTIFPRGIEKVNIPLSAGVATEAEGYTQKPVNPEELLRQADELLKKYG
ncbi:response regulator transcription factor [Chloroflexota bacterium]